MAAPRHRFPWQRTLRAAVCLAAALAMTLATGTDAPALLVVGALTCVNGDDTGPLRRRALRLASVLAGGTAGALLGSIASASGWGQVAAMATTGLVAGALWRHGGTAQLAGLTLMILTCIGFGLGGGIPATQAVGLYLLGSLPMLGILAGTALATVRHRRRPRAVLPPDTETDRTAPSGLREASADPAPVPAPDDRSGVHRRQVLRLASCMGLAAAVAVVLHPRHSSWLPLTACLVFRIDAVPLHRRALHRAAGTTAGVLLALGLTALAPHGWTLVVLALAVGALVPVLTDWSYAGHTAMATVIVLVLANPAAVGDTREITARLLDTVLACLIALAFGHLVWPAHLPHPFRARRRAQQL
ncbi:FUSC family protein [Streptomyces gamaensis]|uniref:FUSC family protein n=1 Tax=Streptomyces gamaensis TaxID=1763542 RepID=A0ABW0YWL6_9ACTN